jgi:universal stress protein A
MHRPKRSGKEAERQLEVYETFARDVVRDHDWAGTTKAVDRILVPIDFSVCSMLALRYAEEMARRFGATIVLLYVDQSLAPRSDLAETRRRAADEEVLLLSGLLRERGLPAQGILRSGGPAAEIMAAAEVEQADLIVMGTHGRTGLTHVLMGSVAETVVRQSPCPVLTVRHATGEETARPRIRRVRASQG